jgi:hypothetical protein
LFASRHRWSGSWAERRREFRRKSQNPTGDGYERAARAALVEVSASVAAGDNVILNPQVDLADGRKVTAIS